MKTTTVITGLLLSIGSVFAQTPKLYIHIVSHNEPTDSLDKSPGIKYSNAKAKALQMASIIDGKNAKWNLQTSDGFVIGALNYDAAGTSTTDIFEILSNPPYSDNIEIDPRSKNKSGRNVADQWYLLDSCGANPTMTLGGFIWAVCPPAPSTSIDWLQYRNPIIGNIYGNSWQCAILSGAGSLSPHCNDLNDFGIFKPLSTTDFYTHDSSPTNNLWCMGVGCAPVLDSLSDEQSIIDLIQGQVDSIQSGLWPTNKFYVTRIMTNQREYGPMFFQKLSKVIDSLNLIPSSQLQWATINETFTAFSSWKTTSGLDYSQWQCGQTTTGIGEIAQSNNHFIYPNPFNNIITIDFYDEHKHRVEIVDFSGRVIYTSFFQSDTFVDLTKFRNGIYLVRIDDRAEKIIKY